MKILVIGDFHGKFPKKFEALIKKEKINLVVSLGDYVKFILRNEFFKHSYGKDIDLWEIIGKKKYKEGTIKGENLGIEILKKLNKLKVLVVTVLGNIEYSLADDVFDVKKPRGKRYWRWEWERPKIFQNLLKRFVNIRYIDYSYFIFNGFIFIGMRGHSIPGKVKSKAFRKHKQKLDKLFKKFSKENKQGKVIFVSHISPYNTKLDKITSKEAPKKVMGKHYGSKLARRIIDKWQPLLNLSGHFHENQGKDRLGKTILVNPGAAYEGKGAIIEIDEEKGKIKKIKFKK